MLSAHLYPGWHASRMSVGIVQICMAQDAKDHPLRAGAGSSEIGPGALASTAICGVPAVPVRVCVNPGKR